MTLTITFPDPPLLGQLAFNSHTVSFSLGRHSKSQRISIRFSPIHHRFHITAPLRCSLAHIEKFLLAHQSWILKHSMQRPRAPVLLKDGVSISLLDVPYQLVYVPHARSNFLIHKNTFIIQTPHKENFSLVARQAFKSFAYNFFQRESLNFSQHIKKQPSLITIKDYKSRWGSCSKTGVLSFSWRLILAPLDVALYVCAHEVAHLQEMHHQKEFWSLVKELYPGFSAPKQWLKKNSRLLFSYEFSSS